MKLNFEYLKSIDLSTDELMWCWCWCLESKCEMVETIIETLMKENKFNWANWIISHVLTNENKSKYAIKAAELMLPHFEEKYSNDMRPRNAIHVAKNYSGNNTKNKLDCLKIADASYAAGIMIEKYFGRSNYMYAAAQAAAHAVYAIITNASYVTYAATSSVKNLFELEIINYGLELLKEMQDS